MTSNGIPPYKHKSGKKVSKKDFTIIVDCGQLHKKVARKNFTAASLIAEAKKK